MFSLIYVISRTRPSNSLTAIETITFQGLLDVGFEVYCASRNMKLMDNVTSLGHFDKCHVIEVNLDDENTIRYALLKTGAGSIFLVTTTDFSYPTDTTFNLTRSYKEAEDLEFDTIRRVSIYSAFILFLESFILYTSYNPTSPISTVF